MDSSTATPIHGRNLDFGLFPAYNFTAHDWDLTELLRPLVVNVQFTQNGQPLFHSIQYVHTIIGLLHFVLLVLELCNT